MEIKKTLIALLALLKNVVNIKIEISELDF